MIYDSNGNPVSSRYRMSIFDWLVILAVAEVAFFASCTPALSASVTHRLDKGAAWSDVSLTTTLPKISPDSARVVYRQDATADGAIDLWSVPISGGDPVRLSLPLTPAQGRFLTFAISPDSSQVVYVVDQGVTGKLDLWSVPIAGGAPAKISATVPDDRDVAGFEISATGRVVYSHDVLRWTKYELFSAPMAGGASVKLSGTMPSDNDVEGFRVTQDGATVVYRTGNTDSDEWDLYSVPTAGNATPRKVSRTLPNGSGVTTDFKLTPDGARVLYLADPDTDNVFVLHSAPIQGGQSVALNLSGSVEAFEVSSDGQRARWTQRNGATVSYWLAPVDGGPVLPALPPVQAPVTSPDGRWALVPVGVELWSEGPSGLHRVSCPGEQVVATYPTRYTPAYSVSPDSSTVVYVAKVGGRLGLYAGPIGEAMCEVFSDGFESGNQGSWR